MPKFAANLTFLFRELPFLDRFEAAAEAGFAGVEVLFPYDDAAAEEIEESVVRPMEEALAGARGVRAIESRVVPGGATIVTGRIGSGGNRRRMGASEEEGRGEKGREGLQPCWWLTGRRRLTRPVVTPPPAPVWLPVSWTTALRVAADSSR